ncbi:MAG: hypothetical protein HN478_13515 [Rhodospirillaceae bacterium]|jgi:hypothetical protein|nr:hypothetical protein [Rhodospirillaceae bacterium]MBT4044319.1 hypothetical protein [Rhodospirillaceae bacterium]MBT4487106.1 hypothetical protein [Rhodospirillaceae bacterium]MBT5195102.1 hypothetical protein [Rhodospirillaceae bacterium]MBT5894422.1 hypothetical protein [Rhodospirillaceae bacterium]
MVSVKNIALEKVRGPELGTALSRWYQLCGHGGLYRREDLGFGPLVSAPEILNGRSSVIATDADDPGNYVISFYGGDFNVYDDQNFVARRLRELPDKDAVEAVIACYGEAIEAREPLAHHIIGTFGGINVAYDRIIFPTINKANKVDRLVTLSYEISRS